MAIQTREAHSGLIVLFLVAKTALVVLSLTVLLPYFVSLAAATGHLINQNLLFAAFLLLITVGGILFGLGRLRPADVGLVRSGIVAGLAVTGSFWLLMQAVLVSSALVTGSLELHPFWSQYGIGPVLGFFVAMLIGTALLEEVSFRGFLLPQLYLKLGGTLRRRLWLAALLPSVSFALLHIPTRVLLSGHGGAALLVQMLSLTAAGLFGVVMYLRTENLFVVVGIHALVNAPTSLVASPVSPFLVTVGLSGVLWLLWPRLRGEPTHFALGEIREAPRREPATVGPVPVP